MIREMDIEWKEPQAQRWTLGQGAAEVSAEIRPETTAALGLARTAQANWAATPVSARLACVRRLRFALAAESAAIAIKLCGPRTPAEFLAAQLIPFLDACRFLEKKAKALLEPRRLRRSPLWLMGVTHEIRREPHGVVLVLAPSNYPFFLPAVQVLQALAAGNAVLLKPGDHGAEAAFEIRDRFSGAGFPQGLIQILGESPEHGAEAIAAGVDKIVLTGSAKTGEAVLAQAAETLTPCTMELSGNDAVFVMDDADARLAAKCVAYGVRLNGGRTCIAPRRVFVWESRVGDFRRELTRAGGKDVRVVNDLDMDGAFGETFVSVIPVSGSAEALRQYQNSDHRLGASIFARDLAKARQFAETLDAGSVCINDLIVPTADGRLPFGGRKRSGFGVTRGAEGLLEMTVTKTISVRAGKFRPHLNAKQAEDATALSGVARLIYGGWAAKWQALAELCQRRKL